MTREWHDSRVIGSALEGHGHHSNNDISMSVDSAGGEERSTAPNTASSPHSVLFVLSMIALLCLLFVCVELYLTRRIVRGRSTDAWEMLSRLEKSLEEDLESLSAELEAEIDGVRSGEGASLFPRTSESLAAELGEVRNVAEATVDDILQSNSHEDLISLSEGDAENLIIFEDPWVREDVELPEDHDEHVNNNDINEPPSIPISPPRSLPPPTLIDLGPSSIVCSSSGSSTCEACWEEPGDSLLDVIRATTPDEVEVAPEYPDTDTLTVPPPSAHEVTCTPVRRPFEIHTEQSLDPSPSSLLRASDDDAPAVSSDVLPRPSPPRAAPAPLPDSTPEAPTEDLTSISMEVAHSDTEDSKWSLSSAPERVYQSSVAVFDMALAMQLRPGFGIGAEAAWMMRFLMAMFGWFAVLLTRRGVTGVERRLIGGSGG